MRRPRALALPRAGGAWRCRSAAWAAEPPPDPTPLWSQYPLEETTPVPGTVDTAPTRTTPPDAVHRAARRDGGARRQRHRGDRARRHRTGRRPPRPPPTGPATTSPAVAPAGSVQDVPAAVVPPAPTVTHRGRDLTWFLVGIAVLLMLGSVAWAVTRSARAAPLRRPTPLPPREPDVERCSVVCERTRGHARFAAVVEDDEGNARIVAELLAFPATVPAPSYVPTAALLAATEALMEALAEERWRRSGTMRTVHEDGGPEHGTPEWYEEQLERVAAARERARTRRRAAP